jgi:hypothetical protein
MMLAGPPVPDDVDGLAELVRAAGADDLADRLERGVADDVKLLALTIDDRRSSWRRSKTRPKGSPSYGACL